VFRACAPFIGEDLEPNRASYELTPRHRPGRCTKLHFETGSRLARRLTRCHWPRSVPAHRAPCRSVPCDARASTSPRSVDSMWSQAVAEQAQPAGRVDGSASHHPGGVPGSLAIRSICVGGTHARRGDRTALRTLWIGEVHANLRPAMEQLVHPRWAKPSEAAIAAPSPGPLIDVLPMGTGGEALQPRHELVPRRASRAPPRSSVKLGKKNNSRARLPRYSK
jgi:hypothetical protein